jgi:hypothetical protein
MMIILPFDTVRALINRFSYNENSRINLFQIQLNQKFEQSKFPLSDMYSFYIVYTFVASFYGFLLPTAAPALVLIFILQYWVDKYNLFRRSSAPDPLSFEHTRILIKSFEVSIFLFALGYVVWQSEVHFDSSPSSKLINVLNIAISTGFVLLSLFTP